MARENEFMAFIVKLFAFFDTQILNNYWMRLKPKAEADNIDTRF